MRYYEQDAQTAVIKMYCDIDWWSANARDFSDMMELLSERYATILIRAHCYGGNVFEGNVIYNSIKASKAHTIVRIEGVAASMFTIIMIAADEIEIVDNGFVMVHAPSTYLHGTAKDMQNAAKLLIGMEKNFVKQYAQKTGKSEDDVRALLDGSDNWFTAEEALAWGLVDRVIEPVVSDLKELPKPEPGANPADVYARYTALLTDDDLPNNSKQTEQMKKLLITMFALTGVTENSTDEEVAAALKQKTDDQNAAQAKANIAAMIATAETASGKPFEATAKAQLQSIGEAAGIAALQMVIGATAQTQPSAAGPAAPPAPAPVPSIISMMGQNSGAASDAKANWDWDKYQKEDPRGLEKLAAENPEAFSALYKNKYGEDFPK